MTKRANASICLAILSSVGVTEYLLTAIELGHILGII